MGFVGDKVALEGTEGVLCLLVLEEPGVADGADTGGDLIPDDEVGLGVE